MQHSNLTASPAWLLPLWADDRRFDATTESAGGPDGETSPRGRLRLGWTRYGIDPAGRGELRTHGGNKEVRKAAVFFFLASGDASYITGQTICVCGGLTLYPDSR